VVPAREAARNVSRRGLQVILLPALSAISAVHTKKIDVPACPEVAGLIPSHQCQWCSFAARDALALPRRIDSGHLCPHS